MYLLTTEINGKKCSFQFSGMDSELDTCNTEKCYIFSGILPEHSAVVRHIWNERKSFCAELSTPQGTWKLLNCKIEKYEPVSHSDFAILRIGMVDD